MSYKPRQHANDQRVADEASSAYLACRFCTKLTLVSTLSEYGRCFHCFEAYCLNGRPPQRNIKPDPAKVRAYLTYLSQSIRQAQQTPRQWADKLREREESGETLTIAQKEAWRAVVREPVPVDEA